MDEILPLLNKNNIKKFTNLLFKFVESIYNSIGFKFKEKKLWREGAFYYEHVISTYRRIYGFLKEHLDKDIDFNFDDIKWGVPLGMGSMHYLNSSRFEIGLHYMLAADYND